MARLIKTPWGGWIDPRAVVAISRFNARSIRIRMMSGVVDITTTLETGDEAKRAVVELAGAINGPESGGPYRGDE